MEITKQSIMKNRIKLLFFFSLVSSMVMVGCGTRSGEPSSSFSSDTTSSSSETLTTSTSSEEPDVCAHEHKEITHVYPTRTVRGHDHVVCLDCGEEFDENFDGLFPVGEENDKTVLFIGNSYTYQPAANAEPYEGSSFKNFLRIATVARYTVSVDNVTTGGYSLLQHADESNNDGALLADKINRHHYDLAIMQEQSLAPVNKTAFFYTGARNLWKKLSAKGINGCFFETWGRKAESNDLPRYGLTNDTMTQILIGNYGAIANELGLPVSHVGTAFYDVYSHHASEIELYASDNFHPSAYGAMLIGYVHYATIFGVSPVGMNVFDYEHEDILQQAAYDAVFGPSILRNEYKTSSVGIGIEIANEDRYTTMDSEVPTEFIETEYETGVGGWEISEDTNGIATFANTKDKSSLIFTTELFKGNGTLSFDLEVNGEFTGSSTQGIVFGSSVPSISWTTANDTYFTVGRRKDGEMGITDIFAGSISNTAQYMANMPNQLEEVNHKYRIKLVVNRTDWTIKTYVDGSFSGVLPMLDKLQGGYVGLSSGMNGGAIISNVQVNGKGIKVIQNEPEPPVVDAEINVTRDTCTIEYDDAGHRILNFSGENPSAIVKNYKMNKTGETIIEYDGEYTFTSGGHEQGVLLGCPDVEYSIYDVGASACIGRLKSGKAGGTIFENTEKVEKATQVGTTYASTTESGPALNAMAAENTVYHCKVVATFINSKKISASIYVDGVLARTMTYQAQTFDYGEYIGFMSGRNGTAKIYNIEINGNKI